MKSKKPIQKKSRKMKELKEDLKLLKKLEAAKKGKFYTYEEVFGKK